MKTLNILKDYMLEIVLSMILLIHGLLSVNSIKWDICISIFSVLIYIWLMKIFGRGSVIEMFLFVFTLISVLLLIQRVHFT